MCHAYTFARRAGILYLRQWFRHAESRLAPAAAVPDSSRRRSWGRLTIRRFAPGLDLRIDLPLETELRCCIPCCCRMTIPSFRSEEHTSELQSLMRISYAVFCLKKKRY